MVTFILLLCYLKKALDFKDSLKSKVSFADEHSESRGHLASFVFNKSVASAGKIVLTDLSIGEVQGLVAAEQKIKDCASLA